MANIALSEPLRRDGPTDEQNGPSTEEVIAA